MTWLNANPIRLAILIATLVAVAVWSWLNAQAAREPIKVGVLHSETGTLAISERSVRDATLLAIAELNARGGLLGRAIEPIVVDGRSDPQTFASEAERLIADEGVSVVFGCWTSASRKTVRPVFEHHNHLLFYPVQYEGLERSPNIVYTGAAPNQQILPAVKWCFDELAVQDVFLVGSDYVFPRTANAIIRAQVKALRGEIVGEEYVLLGSTDVEQVVEQIVAAEPDVILNTINGDSNVAFFAALRRAGITPEQTPTISFSIAEDELRSMNTQSMSGDYAAWNYFQSIPSDENRRFVQSFQEAYGQDRVTDDPIEAGYFGVHLWAQAVEDAESDAPQDVRRNLPNQSYPAPQGIVSIDADNQHTWKTVRIGRIQEDGQFDIVWTSRHPVRPVPYPLYQSREKWAAFLNDLFVGWGESWVNPGNHED